MNARKGLPFRVHLSPGYRRLAPAQRALYLELWLVSGPSGELPDDIETLRIATGNEMRLSRFEEALALLHREGLLECRDGQLWLMDPATARARAAAPRRRLADALGERLPSDCPAIANSLPSDCPAIANPMPSDSPPNAGQMPDECPVRAPSVPSEPRDGTHRAHAGQSLGKRPANARHRVLNDSEELPAEPHAGARVRAQPSLALPSLEKREEEAVVVSSKDPREPCSTTTAEDATEAVVELEGVPADVWAAFEEACRVANEAGHKLKITRWTRSGLGQVLGQYGGKVDPMLVIAGLRSYLTGRAPDKTRRLEQWGDPVALVARRCEYALQDGLTLDRRAKGPQSSSAKRGANATVDYEYDPAAPLGAATGEVWDLAAEA